MNDMCHMSQFVVFVPVSDESSATLASYFTQHVLLKFGLCPLVVLDYGSPFKRTFIAMCEPSNLNHDILAKRNDKSLTVECFHRFLSTSVTISTEESGTNDIFVPFGIAVGYTWNSAPIDGTNFLCNISAIGERFHFLIDANLKVLPKLIQNNGQAALDF